jgi:hypothetical protein
MTATPVNEYEAFHRRHSTRNRQPPSKLHDFVIYIVRHLVNNALTYHRLLSSHISFLNNVP